MTNCNPTGAGADPVAEPSGGVPAIRLPFSAPPPSGRPSGPATPGPLSAGLVWLRRNPAVAGIFLACLLPELLLSGADFGLWGHPEWRRDAFAWGGFWNGLLHNWRPNFPGQSLAMFFTYGFLHGGALHFAVNMLTLFSLGPPLVDRFGQRRFLVIYALSVLGGAVGFALLSQAVQPMVGASGALFGLAGAHVALSTRILRENGESLAPVGRALLWLAGLNLVLWWAMSGHLAWETHLGGFLAGAAVAARFDRTAGRAGR